MKYSILMPYISRPSHLHNTLVSFKHHYRERADWEVVIVEDPKNFSNAIDHEFLHEVIQRFTPSLSIKSFPLEKPGIHNACCAMNLAAQMASGQYYILTSPEVFHKENVLAGLDEEFSRDPNVYVICACADWINSEPFVPSFDALGGGFKAWFQHSVHRPKNLHFCSALSRETWLYVGGFNEAFAYGYGYEDQEFIDRLESRRVRIVSRDDLLTLHQYHEALQRWGGPLWEKNYRLYHSKEI